MTIRSFDLKLFSYIASTTVFSQSIKSTWYCRNLGKSNVIIAIEGSDMSCFNNEAFRSPTAIRAVWSQHQLNLGHGLLLQQCTVQRSRADQGREKLRGRHLPQEIAPVKDFMCPILGWCPMKRSLPSLPLWLGNLQLNECCSCQNQPLKLNDPLMNLK